MLHTPTQLTVENASVCAPSIPVDSHPNLDQAGVVVSSSSTTTTRTQHHRSRPQRIISSKRTGCLRYPSHSLQNTARGGRGGVPFALTSHQALPFKEMSGWLSYFSGKRAPPSRDQTRDAIVEIRSQLLTLEKKEDYLNKRIEEEVKKAKDALAKDGANSAQGKRIATAALRQKKMHEGELEKLAGMRMTLETQVGAGHREVMQGGGVLERLSAGSTTQPQSMPRGLPPLLLSFLFSHLSYSI